MATKKKSEDGTALPAETRVIAGRGAAARPAAKKKSARRPVAKKSAAAKRVAVAEADAADGDGTSPAGGTALVVVESPAKAKTISKYLGRGFRVRATVGHVRDLPEKKLGIDVEKGFTPEYVTIQGKEKTLSELKSAAKESSAIFIATDPDREGEAIGWHVAEQLKRRGGAPIRR